MFLDDINIFFKNEKKLKNSQPLNFNLNKIYKNFNKNKNNIENYNEIKLENFDYDFLLDYNYSKKILNNLKKLKKLKKIQYKFNNVNVELYFYYNNISNSFNNKLIKEIVNLINFNIILFNSIHNNPRKNIKIYFPITNFKKTIDINKNNQLVADNINTGYTRFFSNDYDNYIVIYRYEEIKKVLIHELIHLYNFHLRYDVSNFKINNLIKNNNNNFSIYETYTEVYATIIYTFYYSKLNNLDFNELFNKQILFSNLQAAKVLYSQNIYNLFNTQNIIINEDTNAICYYILKSCMLNNLNKFKILFNKNNGFLLNTKQRVNQFEDILIKSFNKNFKNNINKNLLNLQNNKLNKILLKSFRMNILD